MKTHCFEQSSIYFQPYNDLANLSVTVTTEPVYLAIITHYLHHTFRNLFTDCTLTLFTLNELIYSTSTSITIQTFFLRIIIGFPSFLGVRFSSFFCLSIFIFLLFGHFFEIVNDAHHDKTVMLKKQRTTNKWMTKQYPLFKTTIYPLSNH